MFGAGCIGAKRAGGNGPGDWTDKAGALDVVDFGLRKPIANPRQNGDRLRWRATVVAFESLEAVGVWADDRNRCGRLLQRKKAVLILEQDDGFARHSKGELAMRIGVVLRGSYVRVRIRGRRIEHAEPKARGEETSQGAVQIGFGEQTLMHRVQDFRVLRVHSVAVIAADEIHASLEDCGNSLFGSG